MVVDTQSVVVDVELIWSPVQITPATSPDEQLVSSVIKQLKVFFIIHVTDSNRLLLDIIFKEYRFLTLGFIIFNQSKVIVTLLERMSVYLL